MWNIIECALQGRGHKKNNIPCQDKTYSIAKDNISIIALADGAGSAKLSHFGAEKVTKYICSNLVLNFDYYFSNENGVKVKEKLLNQILNKLRETSKEYDCKLNDLASTLLVVAVKDDNFLIMHIGDGVIGCLKDGVLRVISKPKNGEFSNTTIFTTSKNVIMTMKLIKGKLNNIQGFILMSDGTEASLYNKKENKLAEVLKKVMFNISSFSNEIVKDNLIESFQNVIIQQTFDDCSISFLVKSLDDKKHFLNLNYNEKCDLLKISRDTSKRLKRRYDILLTFLKDGKSLKEVSKEIKLKSKYTKKILDRLNKNNIIIKKNNLYYTLIKL